MAIKRLPIQLANQIAAGEVVERPSSVVKELVENSLDAGANTIEIDIEKGGHKRIRIKDNGCGIAKEELKLALAPHSTSKITTLDDLENIASLGFRGEALASVSSVSRLTLCSKPAQQNEAWSAMAQGRDMEVDITPAAHPNGTTIDVVDLFYNTPARRKFLRAEKTEFQHIEDTVKRIALSRPRVSFMIRHNGKLIKRWPAATSNWSQKRVQQVCGAQFAERAVHTHLNYEQIGLDAWVGDHSLMRSATDLQFCFVNGRAIRDKLLLHAIRQAYESVYEHIEQPAYVLFIELNPNDVDVNVHPAKHEVRFQHGRQIHDLICKLIQDALRQNSDEQATTLTHTSVQHDYIQPLSFVEPSTTTPNTTPSTPYSPRPSSRYVSETRPSPNAVQNYQTLMTPVKGDSSGVDFLVVANQGILACKNGSVIWLSAQQLFACWLTQQLHAANLAQPILMPVSIQKQRNWTSVLVETLETLHFVVELHSSKLILKKVPAGLRQLPWGRIFPAIADELTVLQDDAIDTLVTIIAAQHSLLESEFSQYVHWLKQQSSDAQEAMFSARGSTKSVEQIVAWIQT